MALIAPSNKKVTEAEVIPAVKNLPEAYCTAASVVMLANTTGNAALAVSAASAPSQQADRESQSSSRQTAPKLFPAPSQPASHCPDRPMELLSGLLVGQAFQVAEDDRRPIFLRKPIELLVKH